MIIYNEKKEFIGIAETDLQKFGLIDFGELLHEVDDFADLFVKTPGHIHNFKHVHWIDFIASADSIDQNKVILRVKGKNYRANIGLEPFYLTSNPQKHGYALDLKNVRELTNEEVKQIQDDLEQRSDLEPKEPYVPPVQIETPTPSPRMEEPTPAPVKVKEKEPVVQPVQEEKPLDLILDDVLEKPVAKVVPEVSKPVAKEDKLDLVVEDEVLAPVADEVEIDENDPFKDYHYDPKVASEELGLPTDLVEEFIEDFITQAKEFKSELYDAFENGKIDILRMQSHKLKGVAANLRIEDAYDALVTINTSDDMAAVKHSLDKFYNVMLKKLSGEPIIAMPKQESLHVKEEEPLNDQNELELKLDEEEPLKLEEPQEKHEEEFVLEVKEEEKEPQIQENPLESEDEKIELVLDVPEEEKEEPENFDLKLDEIGLDEEPLDISLEEPAEEPKLASALVIDKEKNASSMGIDVDIYTELLGDFKSDAYDILQTIENDLQNSKEEQLQKLVVRLKGMSENMHIDELVTLCEEFLNVSKEQKETVLKMMTQKINSINEME